MYPSGPPAFPASSRFCSARLTASSTSMLASLTISCIQSVSESFSAVSTRQASAAFLSHWRGSGSLMANLLIFRIRSSARLSDFPGAYASIKRRNIPVCFSKSSVLSCFSVSPDTIDFSRPSALSASSVCPAPSAPSGLSALSASST